MFQNYYGYFDINVGTFQYSSVSLESTNAKELVAGKCDQLEGLIEELDSVKSRMATYLMDLRGAPPIHDKICTIAENASREASVRAQAVNEVVNGHVKILKKQSEDATERAVALKANVSWTSFID